MPLPSARLSAPGMLVLAALLLSACVGADDTILEPGPGNARPEAEILSPNDGAEFQQGESISFRGRATDREDGDLAGDDLVWTSNLEGRLGTGTSFERDDLQLGPHTITLDATDSNGATGRASVEIRVVSGS